MSRDWQRVSARRRCPLCDKADWCSLASDGSAAICMRVESGKPTRNGGWLHRLTEARIQHPSRVRRASVSCHAPPDFGQLAEQLRQAVCAAGLARLAASLGVSVDSLRRLGIGWDGESWAFPMRDATGRVVGIRRRFDNGRKLSVKGGHEGLFVPTGLSSSDVLLICEGPTDAAALLDLGFSVIGRPSCSGGRRHVVRIATGRRAVIVADADGPGQLGANLLAFFLRPHCPSVRVITPPDAIKDARAWKRAGATREDIERTIREAEAVRLKVVVS